MYSIFFVPSNYQSVNTFMCLKLQKIRNKCKAMQFNINQIENFRQGHGSTNHKHVLYGAKMYASIAMKYLYD